MRNRFVSDDINYFWVCGGGALIVAIVFGLASRDVLWSGMLPFILIAAAVLLLGVAGRGNRSLVGGLRWGRAVLVAGSLWVILHDLVLSMIHAISGSSLTSTGAVMLMDVAFAALLFESTRRGGALDRRIWITAVVICGVALLAQFVPIVMAVSAPQGVATLVAGQIASVVGPTGIAALGGILVFAGAAQRFSDTAQQAGATPVLNRQHDVDIAVSDV